MKIHRRPFNAVYQFAMSPTGLNGWLVVGPLILLQRFTPHLSRRPRRKRLAWCRVSAPIDPRSARCAQRGCTVADIHNIMCNAACCTMHGNWPASFSGTSDGLFLPPAASWENCWLSCDGNHFRTIAHITPSCRRRRVNRSLMTRKTRGRKRHASPRRRKTYSEWRKNRIRNVCRTVRPGGKESTRKGPAKVLWVRRIILTTMVEFKCSDDFCPSTLVTSVSFWFLPIRC